MKKLATLLFVVSFFTSNLLIAQCTPDEVNCIDIDQPGQMCPDTLVEGMVNAPYSEVITVIPPASAEVQGTTINLSHIKLIDVINLPPGITYETNAPDNLFEIGSYYCILLTGTPTTDGFFPIEVEVKPYVAGFPMPLTVTDDTSIFITIIPETNALAELAIPRFSVEAVYPNPFHEATEIICNLPQPGDIQFSIFDGLGREVYNLQDYFPQGKQSLKLNGRDLMPGVYYYSISFYDELQNGILMKK